MVARGRFELPSMGLFLVRGVQSLSLAGSLFSTLASPLHHRATKNRVLGQVPISLLRSLTAVSLSCLSTSRKTAQSCQCRVSGATGANDYTPTPHEWNKN